MLTDFPLSEALLSGVEPSADSVDGESDENWFFWDSPNPEDTEQSGEELEDFSPKIDAREPEVDWHGFTDMPEGVFRYRDGTICILDNYRAEHSLSPITFSMQTELFWASFKPKAWSRLKLADYLDGKILQRNKTTEKSGAGLLCEADPPTLNTKAPDTGRSI